MSYPIIVFFEEIEIHLSIGAQHIAPNGIHMRMCQSNVLGMSG